MPSRIDYLVIDCQDCRVVLSGPVASRKIASAPRSAHLSVARDDPTKINFITWLDDEGQLRDAGAGVGFGPRLLEQTTYVLSVVSKVADEPVRVRHRDPGMVADVTSVGGRLDVVSGRVNFRSGIGRSRFMIDAPAGVVEVVVEVWPTKMDYESDYEILLAEVADLSRLLVLEYLSSTTRAGGTGSRERGSDLDWVILLHEEVERLVNALAKIAAEPLSALAREPRPQRVDLIRRPDAATRRTLARGVGRGEAQAIDNLPIREVIESTRAVDQLDTPEHRWLRRQVSEICRRLAVLRIGREPSEVSSAPVSARFEAIQRELRMMSDVISPYLGRSPLADATADVHGGFSSLALQGRPGYAEAYRSILRLRLALDVRGESLDLSVKDLNTLYEMWCFLAVVRSVCRHLNVVIDPAGVLSIEDGGIRVRLRKGRASDLALTGGQGQVRVRYNPSYRGPTGSQTPDIVVGVQRPGLREAIFIFDAKYRLETSDEYVRTFRSPGPPVDAVNQLHRYRDAIVVSQSNDRHRPVVRGAALFPLQESDAAAFTQHPFLAALNDLGIGALPLLPQQTQWLDDWLGQVLRSNDVGLAWPGPPFGAWEDVLDSLARQRL